MRAFSKFDQYFRFFISPYKAHEGEEGLLVSESLLLSWVFVIISGIFKIFTLNIVLLGLGEYLGDLNTLGQEFLNKDTNSAYYFFVLSTILEVIFFPLFSLFVIKFWYFFIRTFAGFVEAAGDVDLAAEKSVTGAMSSYILSIIPIIGSFFQGLYFLILLYIGMRVNLKFSRGLAFCVLLTPLVIFLAMLLLLSLLVGLKLAGA